MILKFRAWEPETKYMNDQVRVTSNRFGSDEVWVEATESFGWIELKPEHLMQSTGLKDKNGVEIFEGDIFKEGFGFYVVAFLREEARFVLKASDFWLPVSESLVREMELVGNIYENPELLEVAE